MFNSTVLDVAIGMIFVYLLLSLMCTAANELIELMLKKRAIDLERGIREMLAPGSKSGTKDIVEKLYDHSLINNLFDHRYEDSRIASVKRYVMRTHLPSYIPARSFALALMDLVGTPPAAGAAPPAPPPAAGAALPVPPPASGATGATPASNFEITMAQSPPPPPPPGDPGNPLTPLRQGIASSPLLNAVPDVRQALIALVDAAGADIAKARENIETWFNSSMDRISSWYKRRTQVVILILGLFVAVVVNADSIAIAKRLSNDRSLRESLVASAQEYAKVKAAASPSSSPSPSPSPVSPAKEEGAKVSQPSSPSGNSSESPGSSTSSAGSSSGSGSTTTAGSSPEPPTPQSCVDDKDSNKCKHDRELQKNFKVCQRDLKSSECKLEDILQMFSVCKDGKRDSPGCRYEENLQRIQTLGLPIGWDAIDDSWWDQIYWHLLGWLLTALAISLGAPFWFDLLNKFIVIRSAVKPHEKGPEKESKG
jgi:hypothetical protein